MSRFSVDTHLFRELGRLLVGRDSTALVELIKNSYDADATSVVIHAENLHVPESGSIVISDDGNGMTSKEFIAGFLTIASRGKEEGAKRSLRFSRRFTGAKGVGRLAAHKLAAEIEVNSIPHPALIGVGQGGKGVSATINWDKIEEYKNLEDVPESAVKVVSIPVKNGANGTSIHLRKLRKAWTSAMRSAFLREVETFLVPESLVANPSGKVAMHSLFSEPKIYDLGGKKSHPFKVRFTGELDAGDSNFLDSVATADWLIEIRCDEKSPTYTVNIEPTVSAKRLNGNLRGRIFELKRPKGSPAFEARIFSRWGKAWDKPGIRFYQEGFRVLPYGESNNDWLELDAVYKQRDRRLRFLDQAGVAEGDAIEDEGLSSIGNKGFFGAVFVTSKGAPTLEMLVNREGFVPSEEFEQIRSMVQTAIQLNIRERARHSARERSLRREIRSGARSESVSAGQSIARALVQIDEIIENKSLKSIDSKQVDKVSDALSIVKSSFQDAESERGRNRLLAAIGLQLSAFLHEIRGLLVHSREVQNLSEQLKELLTGRAERAVATTLINRLAELKFSLERQANYLEDVATADARRRRSKQKISLCFDSAARLYGPEAQRKDVEITSSIDEELRTTVPMFSSELVLVFSNLLSNALKATRRGGRIHAAAKLQSRGLEIRVSNTGRKVSLKDSERWFLPFESSSNDPEMLLGRGMGLGLTIVREMLEDYGITVSFVEPPDGFATSLKIFMP